VFVDGTSACGTRPIGSGGSGTAVVVEDFVVGSSLGNEGFPPAADTVLALRFSRFQVAALMYVRHLFHHLP